MGFLLDKNIVFKAVEYSKKFRARQFEQIAKYGAKQEPRRSGVTAKIMDAFTPYRRHSMKPGELSEPKWFIERFEQMNTRTLPSGWKSMSEAEKVDYIVKDRYSRLVSNKIMNAIKDEPVEHSFSLSHSGEILAHDIGNECRVDFENADESARLSRLDRLFNAYYGGSIHVEDSAINIHNHPGGGSVTGSNFKLVREYMKKHNITAPKECYPFSSADVAMCMKRGERGYVVDANGHKFVFTPYYWRADYDAGKKIEQLSEEIAEGPAKNLEELYKIADEYKKYIKDSGHDKNIAAKLYEKLSQKLTEVHLRFVDMKHRKKFLESDIVKDYFGHYEQLC